MRYGDNHPALEPRQLQESKSLLHQVGLHCHVHEALKQNVVRLSRYSKAHAHLIHRYRHQLYLRLEELVSLLYEVLVPKYHLHRVRPLEHQLQSREHLLLASPIQRWHLPVLKFHLV